jgi:hypothetical protein
MPVLSIPLCSTGQLSLHLSEDGNALIGLTYKYKWNDQINWRMVNFSWMNFLGILKGEITAGKINMVISYVSHYNAFHIDNLLLQLEYNYVRPYVYSHMVPILQITWT